MGGTQPPISRRGVSKLVAPTDNPVYSAEFTRVPACDMGAARTRVSGTSATLSQARVTSNLSALSVTGSAGRLSTPGLTRVAGHLAGRLSTLSLARVAGRPTLRRTSIASYAARISRTCAAVRAACIATRTEAGIPAACTGETGRVAASSPTTVGATRCIELSPNALRRQSLLSTTTELNIKVELVARFMSA